jgi:hypothetical protein
MLVIHVTGFDLTTVNIGKLTLSCMYFTFKNFTIADKDRNYALKAFHLM